MKPDNEAMTELYKVIIALLLSPFAAIWQGYVIAKLWLWFIVAFGAPELSTPHAAGLMLLLAMVTIPFRHDGSKKILEQMVLQCAFLYPIVLVAGFLYHGFMQ